MEDTQLNCVNEKNRRATNTVLLIRPIRKGGPLYNPRRIMYAQRYGITGDSRKYRGLSLKVLDQLDACLDESARRVLLDKGRPRNTKGE
jgi:hypothetical protein